MKLEIAIDTLQAMIDRLRGEDMVVDCDDETEALQRAIDCLTTAVIKREAEINRAVNMIREISGWPDKDIRDVWFFLRDKIRFSEDEKLEIESRLGIR